MDAQDLHSLEAQTQQVFETIFSFVPALVLKSVLLLKIPDIIANAGPDASLSLQQIAACLPTQTPNLDCLSRILRYLSGKGIFVESKTNTDPSHFRYALTHAAKLFYVTQNNPSNLVPVVLMQTHEVLMAPWHHLHECVLEGGHAFEKAHGKDIWAYGRDDPHVNNIVNDCMTSFTMLGMQQVVSCYQGFNDFKTVVDVGGGKGTALGQIVKAYPHIHGINFDLPHVVHTAPSIPGIEHMGGNMFEGIPTADAIFMKNVLHDWDDESCTKVLENCYKALPENGKLILAEAVLSDQSEVSKWGEIVGDLVMIAHANGGRERSEQQWRTLLQNSGFSLLNIIPLSGTSAKLKIIETTKLKKI